VKSFSLFI